jgi:Uma2 family endonuclease
MADNTRQFDWIVAIKGGLEAAFRNSDRVFVAGDLFWYPVEGRPDIVVAPDAMVAFGRPRGHRKSYLQWEEDNIAPQVVFEILSQSNTPAKMRDKKDFYLKYGVQEYYTFDPDKIILEGWIRKGNQFQPVEDIEKGWTSPLLGAYFEVGDDLQIIGSDGKPFTTYLELSLERDLANEVADRERKEKENHRKRAVREQARADQERARADSEQALREDERTRAEHERARAERYLAKLKELGIDLNGDQ